MYGGEVIRLVTQFASFCNREVDGCLEKGRVDSFGFKYYGLKTRYVPPGRVNVPTVDFRPI